MFSAKHTTDGISPAVEEDEDLITQKAIDIARGIEFHMAMKSTIELGILDTISEANKGGFNLSASEVATKIPGCVNPNAPVFIDCILSLLTSFSVLKCELRSKVNKEEKEEKVYSIAPVGKYFLSNEVDGSLGPLLCMYYDKVALNTWSHLNYAIKEGGTTMERAYGMKGFESAEKDPRINRVFNNAMSNYTLIVMKKILDVYKGFGAGINVLVDVGGGTASSLMLITSKYPKIRGINFDLPHVVAQAPIYPGVENVGGDMLEKVPAGDAIFLKWVLHNWNHKDCVLLLKNCWIALPSKGKVIIMEKLLPLVPENDHASQITLSTNLGMYSVFGATERTIEEYKTLAMESGFSDCRLICSAYNNWILELLKE